MTQAHRYSIRPSDPAAHLFEVRITVAEPHPDGQAFAMPAWTPGSYLVRDYARNVVSIRAESDGLGVQLSKADKHTWLAEPVSRPLTVIAEIFGYEDSVRSAHLDLTHGFINGPCVFLAAVGQEHVACELEILPPEKPLGKDWRVATSMRRSSADVYAFGGYEADDFFDLIDHPVEMGVMSIGEFEAGGVPHAIAIRGRTKCDMARLCHDLTILCEQHQSLLGKPADLDRYLFLLNATGKGYGGLEHRWSSALVCDRDNLPPKGAEGVDDNYRTFLGLASHEYWHLWHVKRMKPAAFSPADLSTEAYTELLWVFEGITSYYDDLALLRSGLIGEKSYLELLGRTMTRVRRGAGRTRQSVAQSSFDAWIKYYKQDANAANAVVSYYTKGALIALALDLKLRVETDSRVSLDDVMRELWARYADNPDGVPEDGFERVAAEVSGLDLGDFFDAAVRGTGELPLETVLREHGVELKMRAAIDRKDRGGRKRAAARAPAVAFGARFTSNDGRLVFAALDNGGSAERAGVAPGDEAVALDGLALTPANLARRLLGCRVNDKMLLVVFRGDELLSLKIRFQAAPEDTCYLELVEEVPVDVETRRAAWLAG